MIDLREQDEPTRRKLQQQYGLFAVEEPTMTEVQQETQTPKAKRDPSLQVLEGMRDAFQGMERAASQMAQSSSHAPREYTYWSTVKHTLQVCSVAVPIAMLAAAGTLWSIRKLV